MKTRLRKIMYAALVVCVLAAAGLGLAACASDEDDDEYNPAAGDSKPVTISGIPSFNLRYVPAGTFMIDQGDNAAPPTANHNMTITKGYWMGETEVTQELFAAVMGGEKPSSFTANPEDATPNGWKKLPVEYVNWYAAIAFCNKLSLKNGKTPVYGVTGITNWATLAYSAIPTSTDTNWDAATMNTAASGYRLPTEMQWMWAAMGATKGGTGVAANGYKKEFAGDADMAATGQSPDNYAWHYTNSSSKTHEVGKKTANELGLRDMSGNVIEWCWDWRASGYPGSTVSDYPGPATGTYRVMRGGGWSDGAALCAVANRGYGSPSFRDGDVGFRVASP